MIDHNSVQAVRRRGVSRFRSLLRGILGPVLLLAATGLPRLQEDSAHFFRIGLNEGISQTTINCIAQDSRGFLWFGTQDGLNRYDGYVVSVFRHVPGDPNSIGGNNVRALCPDSQGNLWIATEGDLCRFDTRAERFTRFPLPKGLPKEHAPFSLALGRDGSLFIGTLGDGLRRLHPVSGRITRVDGSAAASRDSGSKTVQSLYSGSDGIVWVGTARGLSAFNPGTGDFLPPRAGAWEKTLLHGFSVNGITADSRGRLWLATSQGLKCYHPKTGYLRSYRARPSDVHSLPDDNTRSVAVDEQGSVWAACGTTLVRLTPETGRVLRISQQVDNPFSLSGNTVTTVYRDRDNNLWVGTYGGGGVNRLNLGHSAFLHYLKRSDREDGLKDSRTRALLESRDGALWVGTYSGLHCRPPGKEGFVCYQHDPGNRASLGSNMVWALHEDRSGRLWVGTIGGGLSLMDRQRGTFTSFRHDPDSPESLASDDVRVLFMDSRGSLWIGTDAMGLDMLDRSTGSFRHYRNRPGAPGTLGGNAVRSIVEDRQGFLWVGTYGGGISRRNPVSGEFTCFRNTPDDPGSLSSDFVLSTFCDRDGQIWVGTSAGLNRFDPAAGIFFRYRAQTGLPNDVIYAIEQDFAGDLWVSTNKGLSRLTPGTGRFLSFDTEDGLQSDEFNAGTSCRGRDGRLYFGGIQGFNEFYPDRVDQKPRLPRATLTGFLLFSKNVEIRSPNRPPGSDHFTLPCCIGSLDHLVLDYTESVFSLEFSALSFSHQQKIRFVYKLEGFDSDWIPTDARNRRATYTSLPPGDYRFEVRACDNNGVWNLEGASLPVTILPPPWKTWWAYSLYLLLAGVSVFGLIAWRSHRLRRENQILECKVSDRTAQLTAAFRDMERVNAHLNERTAELGQANRRLQEMDKIKTDFINMAAHEFRTPLTSVVGFAILNRKRFEDVILPHLDLSRRSVSRAVNQIRKNFEIMVGEGNRLSGLINDLLDIAKIEAGKVDWEMTPFELDEILEQAVETMTPLFEHQGTECRKEYRRPLPAVLGNRERLLQVTLNLLSNALKFTPRGGHVAVRAVGPEGNDGHVQISIADTGIGIAPENIDKVFEKFRQLGDGQNGFMKGTGLGLPISRMIIEHHKGRIWAESRLGEGSTFHVALPVYRPGPAER